MGTGATGVVGTTGDGVTTGAGEHPGHGVDVAFTASAGVLSTEGQSGAQAGRQPPGGQGGQPSGGQAGMQGSGGHGPTGTLLLKTAGVVAGGGGGGGGVGVDEGVDMRYGQSGTSGPQEKMVLMEVEGRMGSLVSMGASSQSSTMVDTTAAPASLFLYRLYSPLSPSAGPPQWPLLSSPSTHSVLHLASSTTSNLTASLEPAVSHWQPPPMAAKVAFPAHESWHWSGVKGAKKSMMTGKEAEGAETQPT